VIIIAIVIITNMLDPSYLGLANMLNLFFGFGNYILPMGFCNGQHNFLGGKREGQKTPQSKLIHGPPLHKHLAIVSGLARRI